MGMDPAVRMVPTPEVVMMVGKAQTLLMMGKAMAEVLQAAVPNATLSRIKTLVAEYSRIIKIR